VAPTLLYRLFGLGKLPRAQRPILEQERIVLCDEGLSGSLTLRSVRAPGRRHSYRKSWFTGSLVITERRVAAFVFSRAVVDLPLDHPQLADLRVTTVGDTLSITFDAGLFHQGWSGTIEIRLSTPRALLYQDRLTTAQAALASSAR
jgi:hypothetical protein